MATDRVSLDIEPLESYLKRALAKDESITLCKAFHVGNFEKKSTEITRPVKMAFCSVGERN